MASEEEVFNLTAHREVLRSFSPSDTEMSVEQNLCSACAHDSSLMCQLVAAEDTLEMAHVLDAERETMEQLIAMQINASNTSYLPSITCTYNMGAPYAQHLSI